jgi:DNA polymerase-3 subunit delta'
MTGTDDADGAPPPRANAELSGQETAERVLSRAAADGRLPHAWLLTGPRGVGKATLAYRFARFILAGGLPGPGRDAAPQARLFGDAADEDAPVGADMTVPPEHPVFRQIAGGGHLNLQTLEPQVAEATGKRRRDIRVDEVRKAISFLRLTPADGGWRVVIVDAADDLNANAANALLKVLEEPPPRALLLLVSHAPARLLPTIRSRCCHLAFSPLPEAAVAELLTRYGPALSEEDTLALARLADGSIGRALELAESGGLELYKELVDLLQGLVPATAGAETATARLDAGRLHALADRLSRGTDGGAFRAASELFVWWLARMIRAGSCGRMPQDVVPGEGALMTGLLARRNLAQWLALWDKISRLLTRVESANLDRKQALLAAFLELEAVTASE